MKSKYLIEKIIFIIIFIVINLSIIFYRQEVGLYSWSLNNDFKKKFTKIDNIIFNKSNSFIAINLIKSFYGNKLSNTIIYIQPNLDINSWSFYVNFNYYCSIIDCKVNKEDKVRSDLFFLESVKTNKYNKIINFDNFIDGFYIKKIYLQNCQTFTKKKKFFIFILDNGLYMNCN